LIKSRKNPQIILKVLLMREKKKLVKFMEVIWAFAILMNRDIGILDKYYHINPNLFTKIY